MSQNLKIKFQKRKGFTLLEVLFAALALAIVTTLLFSITTSAHLTTLNVTGKIIAQNIAQATMEDIKAQNNYQLDLLIAGGLEITNYPKNGTHLAGEMDWVAPEFGRNYHVKTGSQISLGIANIILFDYRNNAFSRDITITKLPTNLLTDPEKYSIDIIIRWKLNSTIENQKLEITGTKN